MTPLLRSPSQLVNPLARQRFLGFGTAPGGAGFVGALDAYTAGLAVVWSVRRLLSSYTGALIRVRRSSDNTEQDIGYTSSGALDTTALLAFCGAGSGFIRWVYDQKTGTAINIGQSTAATQPRIVNAGALETAGMRFLGSQYLDTASLAFSNFAGAQDVQLASVMTLAALGNVKFFDFGPDVISTWLPFSGQIYWDNPFPSARINFSTPTGFEGVQRSISFERASTASCVRIDGSVSHNATVSGSISGTGIFRLGALVSTGSSAWTGHVRDFVIWKNNTNATARIAALAA
jgi:hypothetical protein